MAFYIVAAKRYWHLLRSRSFYVTFIKLFLIFNSINIILFVLSRFWFIDRPVFLIEYNLLPILLIAGFPFWVFAVALVFLLVPDMLIFTSSIFYLTWIDFLDAGKFLYLHEDRSVIILSFIILVAVLILVLWRINNSYIRKIAKTSIIVYLFISTLLIFLSDILNGSSYLNSMVPLINKNMASSVAENVYVTYKMQLSSDQVPNTFINSEGKGSAAFNYFNQQNQTPKQLLIIIESWGILKQYDYKLLLALLKVRVKDYSISFGRSSFNGSTTGAELRELTNKSGSYKYYINHLSKNSGGSLFDIKKQFQYHTIGAHSFSGAMFYRKTWWYNLGLQEAYFFEDLMREGQKPKIINAESPFRSLNDEYTFNFISRKASQKQRVFAYMLTENTHLPFKYRFNNESLNFEERATLMKSLQTFPKEIAMQELRIFEQISYYLSNLSVGNWDEMLIVGDHSPPYSEIGFRNAYSPGEVPFIFIKRE